ncbi:hypothetical protein B0T16DRAFT_402197 [Cercophora newfieldiana]|uniref:Uncharacterized protein n=1 Tax=Cercophora newfieldiana TaxID=92897 RepID=A0AA39YS60_9PEZI|nr:hypothetical protein B0T16DRAFT_402197 [Cercophora newfieldiana]
MAWWDSKNRHRSLGATSPLSKVSCSPVVPSSPASPTTTTTKTKRRLALGDAFPVLEPEPRRSTNMTMDQRRAQLSPVFEAQPALLSAPALVVHVEIQFTDPVIRSRYSRSYGSSPDFTPSARLCKGLLRRIERCSEELLTRKDSGALGMFKDGTFERKPLRYEIAFRISTREGGDWAERTYRSYQKQPLTVSLTKDIIVASHRIVGLFLRRHDKDFRWLDGAVRDTSIEGPQTMSPSTDGPLSLLCVPRSRFIESAQSFEFVPGYTLDLSFRSRDPRRAVPVFAKEVRIGSEQTAPLTLFMSEDMLWQGLQAANKGLEPKKQEFDAHLSSCPGGDCHHSDEESLRIELRITNNLGPIHDDIRRTVQSKLALFSDTKSCEEFVQGIETALVGIRDEADGKINALNDFELRIVELRGTGWSVHQPAVFSLDASASYGRRTIQAALDRVQTGIADVLRGFDVAIHISGHKRGHLILDKAIVAHAKRGIPKEVFSSPEDEQKIFTSRLKARIQQDIDKVFEDTCSIDDIPEEEQRPVSPSTIAGTEAGTPEKRTLGDYSPSHFGSLPTTPVKNSPKPRVQRMFSLSSRRSTRADTESLKSAGSTNDLRSIGDVAENRSNRAVSVASEDVSEGPSLMYEERPSLYARSPIKPAQRRFPLVSKRYSSRISNVSNASTLIEEFQGSFEDSGSGDCAHNEDAQRALELGNVAVEAAQAKRAPSDESAQALQKSGDALREMGDALNPMTRGETETDDVDARTRMNLVAEPRINLTDGSVCHAESQSGTRVNCQNSQQQPQATQIMDTPETFEDAQEEFASSGPVVVDHLAEISANLKAISPADFASPGPEIYSTAPSTPGLSWGADSSPRNSISATPTDQRTVSGASVRNFEPESEPDEAEEMGVAATINEVSVCKAVDDKNNDAHPILVDLVPQIACPESLRPLGSDASPTEPVGSEETATPEPEATTDRQGSGATETSTDIAELGPEHSTTPPEECGAPTPDSPTGDIREADTETTSAPEPRPELGVDEPFGPANLWGIVKSPETSTAVPAVVSLPNLQEEESEKKGPAELWGILSEVRVQELPEAIAVEETVAEEPVEEELPAATQDEPLPEVVAEVPTPEEAPVEEAAQEEPAAEEVEPEEAVPDVSVAEKSEPEEPIVEAPTQEEPVAEVLAPEEATQEIALADESLGPVNLWGIISSGEITSAATETEIHSDSEWVVVEPETCASIGSVQSEAADIESAPEPAEEEPGLVPAVSEAPIEEAVGQEKPDADLPAEETEPEKANESVVVDVVEIADEKLGGAEDLASVEVGPADATRDLEIDGADTSLPGADAVAVGATELNEAPAPVSEVDAVEDTTQDNAVAYEPEVPEEKIVAPEVENTASVQTVLDVQPDLDAVLPVIDATKVVDDQIGESAAVVEVTAKDIPESTTVCNGAEDVASSEVLLSVELVEDAAVEVAEVKVEEVEVVEPQVQAPESETTTFVVVETETIKDSEQLTSANIPEPVTNDREIPTEVSNDQDTPASVNHDDDDAAGFKGDSGSEIENLTPEVSDDKPPVVVAPEISMQDFAPTAPEPPLATTNDVVVVHVSHQASQQPSASDESLLAPTVTRIAADTSTHTIGNVVYLSPSSVPRTSTSSVEWSDVQSVVNASRDSVETFYRPSYEARQAVQRAESPERERCQSRPQTAGFLGLRENRLELVGLRGALGDSRSRRLSLPLQNFPLGVQQDAVAAETESVVGDKDKDTVKKSKRRGFRSGSKKEKEDAEEDNSGPTVLPKMMFLIVGMVALGKALKGPSSH